MRKCSILSHYSMKMVLMHFDNAIYGDKSIVLKDLRAINNFEELF